MERLKVFCVHCPCRRHNTDTFSPRYFLVCCTKALLDSGNRCIDGFQSWADQLMLQSSHFEH